MTTLYDVAIIGGGINGCACAADAALRGLSVVLLEQGDLAAHTSSSSTKLIHGGLRYLENYEFSMVKKSLEERQNLLKIAPHLVLPQAIVLPWQPTMRPAWLLRMGLFLYDHLSSKNTLMRSQAIKAPHDWLAPLLPDFSRGFIFYDAKTDDARLTLENALQANNHGARIYTHTTFQKATVERNIWHLDISTDTGIQHIQAKSVINTSGPWVNQVASQLGVPHLHDITLVKGSHIVVPPLYVGSHGYLLQHKDKRIIFVLPFHGYSMVGTTDVLWEDSAKKPVISDAEIAYFCELTNTIFQKKTQPTDVVSSWSGLRTLLAEEKDSVASISRDYTFKVSNKPGLAVTVYGGKLTTYRKLAAQIIDNIAPLLGNKTPCRTSNTPLPGALSEKNIPWDLYKKSMEDNYSWLPPDLLARYLRTYGTRTSLLINNCASKEDLGEHFGHGLYEQEVIFLIREEWATNTDDILWRRTKLGLFFQAGDIQKLNDWLEKTRSIV